MRRYLALAIRIIDRALKYFCHSRAGNGKRVIGPILRFRLADMRYQSDENKV